jgi:hypothetical protein
VGFEGNTEAANLHVGSGQIYSTIASTISASSAGDTIIIHSGTYNEYNLHPRSNTVLKGAEGEDRPLIDGEQSNCSQNPIFDMNSVNNITFDGLIVTGGGTHFRGNWFIGENGTCNNIVINNCETFITGACQSADNPAVLVLNDCDDCVIKNTRIYGVNVIGQSKEMAGLKIWRYSTNPVIENCEIFDLTGKLLDNKHGTSDQSITARNNYLHNGKEGIHNNADYSLFENNLVVNCRNGVRSYYSAGSMGGSNTVYKHNTFYNCENGIMVPDGPETGCVNVTIQNNVVVGYQGGEMKGLNISPYGASYSHNFIVDHNLYYSSSTADIVDEFAINYNLLEWQAKGYGTGSINSAPSFVGGASPSTIADYALATGSIGKNAASDGTDMGADIELVGIKDSLAPAIQYNVKYNNVSNLNKTNSVSIEIFDVFGRQISKNKLNRINNLSSKIYYSVIKTSNGVSCKKYIRIN